MDLLSLQQRNLSFSKKCVFKVGDHCGFFSEYNNMLFAVIYCMINGYQFILSSKWANFRSDKGWIDYFEPFCNERNFILDYYYFNDRLRYSPIRKKEKYKGYIMLICFGWIYAIYSWIHDIKLFTWNLDDKYRKQSISEQYIFPELQFEGSFIDLCREINTLIWRYNEKTQKEIDALMPNIEAEYVSVHVRRGDKSTEVEHTPLEKYMAYLTENTNIRNCFVATDDYSVFQHLREKYPEWSFFTITKPEETGFNEYAYNGRNKYMKRQEMIELFATIEIMARSKLFVGTLSSNIGMYMYWRMPEGKCIGVDYKDWRIW